MWRRIDSQIWGDGRFVALTDDAKLLFLLLVTHPQMTGLGAMRASIATLADDLGWDQKRTASALAALASRTPSGKASETPSGKASETPSEKASETTPMVEFDPAARAVYLPRFVVYNPPGSPNATACWRTGIQVVPECSLRARAALVACEWLVKAGFRFTAQVPRHVVEDLAAEVRRVFPDGIGDAFKDAFPDVFRKPSATPPSIGLGIDHGSGSSDPRSKKKKASSPPPALLEDHRPTGEEDAAILELMSEWSRVWGVDFPESRPVADNLQRILQAIRHPHIGIELAKQAIRGHHKLATKDGSTLGRELRHVFPPQDRNGKKDTRHLDTDRVREFWRAGHDKASRKWNMRGGA